MSEDFKIKPMVKRVKSHQIQKLIRDIRLVEQKRGTEKQIEKNKRRATRLQKKVEALRKIDLEQICSQFNDLTGPPSTNTIERALSEAVASEDHPKAPSQSLADHQQHSGNDFFIMDDTAMTTTASPLRANDVKRKNEDSRKTVSCHSSKHLSLNSLFLQSLGDEDSSLLKTKNRKGQRARQRMWELKYGKDAKHLKKSNKKCTTVTVRTKGQRSRLTANSEPIHPSWTASKRLKQKAHSIKQFKGTHVVFSDL